MVLTGKATIQADRILGGDFYNKGNPDQLPKSEVVKLVWKEFIPPAIMGVATVTCIIAANHVGTRRTAAIAAAFKISEEMATEYKNKVIESVGKKTEETIQANLAKDRMERVGGYDTLIPVGSEAMFFDAFSGRFFKSDWEKVRGAVNDINFQIINNFYASLSDLYDRLGLSRTELSDEFGWNTDEKLEASYTAVLMDNNLPAVQITFNKTPIRGYDRVM